MNRTTLAMAVHDDSTINIVLLLLLLLLQQQQQLLLLLLLRVVLLFTSRNTHAIANIKPRDTARNQ